MNTYVFVVCVAMCCSVCCSMCCSVCLKDTYEALLNWIHMELTNTYGANQKKIHIGYITNSSVPMYISFKNALNISSGGVNM